MPTPSRPTPRRAWFIIVNMQSMPCFLADQVTDGAALVAHGHGAGGGGVHAELVLDAARIDVVLRAERAVGVHHEFRNQEQRNPLGARGRIGQARQHE